MWLYIAMIVYNHLYLYIRPHLYIYIYTYAVYHLHMNSGDATHFASRMEHHASYQRSQDQSSRHARHLSKIRAAGLRVCLHVSWLIPGMVSGV